MGARSRRGRSITLARDPFCGKGPKAAEPKSEVTVTRSGEEGTATRASVRSMPPYSECGTRGEPSRATPAPEREIVAVTGSTRQGGGPAAPAGAPAARGACTRGSPRAYSPAVGSAEVLWHASSRIGAHRPTSAVRRWTLPCRACLLALSLLPGHTPAQAAACCALQNTGMSVPSSATMIAATRGLPPGISRSRR